MKKVFGGILVLGILLLAAGPVEIKEAEKPGVRKASGGTGAPAATPFPAPPKHYQVGESVDAEGLVFTLTEPLCSIGRHLGGCRGGSGRQAWP